MSPFAIACISISGASIFACLWTVAASLRRDYAPLPDLLERSVSVERRAMAEWRQP